MNTNEIISYDLSRTPNLGQLERMLNKAFEKFPSVDVYKRQEIAEIEAKSEGTAILLVTYDAEINKPGMGLSLIHI